MEFNLKVWEKTNFFRENDIDFNIKNDKFILYNDVELRVGLSKYKDLFAKDIKTILDAFLQDTIILGNLHLDYLEYLPKDFSPNVKGNIFLPNLKSKSLKKLIRYPGIQRQLAFNLLKNIKYNELYFEKLQYEKDTRRFFEEYFFEGQYYTKSDVLEYKYFSDWVDDSCSNYVGYYYTLDNFTLIVNRSNTNKSDLFDLCIVKPGITSSSDTWGVNPEIFKNKIEKLKIQELILIINRLKWN